MACCLKLFVVDGAGNMKKARRALEPGKMPGHCDYPEVYPVFLPISLEPFENIEAASNSLARYV
jgi:hypothetical protein